MQTKPADSTEEHSLKKRLQYVCTSKNQIYRELYVRDRLDHLGQLDKTKFFFLLLQSNFITLFGQLNKRRGGTRPKSWVDFTFIVYRVPRVPPSTNLCYKQRYKITARYDQTQVDFTFIVQGLQGGYSTEVFVTNKDKQ